MKKKEKQKKVGTPSGGVKHLLEKSVATPSRAETDPWFTVWLKAQTATASPSINGGKVRPGVPPRGPT